MANYRRFDYGYREPRRYDYDDGRDCSWEPWYNQGYQNDPNPDWSDYRSHGFENTDRYDWRDGNRGDYIHNEDREPSSWQYQQQFSIPRNDDFEDDYATSFNDGGRYNSDNWNDSSPYQDPSPSQQQNDTLNLLLQQLQQLNQAMEDSFLASEQRDKEHQAQMQMMDAQMRQMDVEIASNYTFPSPTQLLPKIMSYEDFESGIENEENEEEKSEESKLENEKEEVMRVEENEKEEEMSEQKSEEAPHPNNEPPPPYHQETTTEDAALIQLLKDYVASCSLEELWGKGAHEEEKESEQVHVPEIEEELLNTPPKVVEVPIEVMSASVDRDPSEVSRYGRQHQDSRECHTKKPGKGNEERRKTSKLLLFPSYFKSRWRDTFDGLHTIPGLALGICAEGDLLVQSKDDLRPP